MEDKKDTKIIISIMITLLIISLLAIMGTLFYYHWVSKNNTATVVVPNNLITSKENEEEKEAATIELYKRHAKDNKPFKIRNMFPGDKETKYFCVNVTYQDEVTVHYKATIKKGYEKLAEVLKVKVVMLSNNNEIMYDGLMKDMPASLRYKMSSPEKVSEQLYYEITVYLDTSVTNEYQNKELAADFSWWLQEEEKEQPQPEPDDIEEEEDKSDKVGKGLIIIAIVDLLILLLFSLTATLTNGWVIIMLLAYKSMEGKRKCQKEKPRRD